MLRNKFLKNRNNLWRHKEIVCVVLVSHEQELASRKLNGHRGVAWRTHVRRCFHIDFTFTNFYNKKIIKKKFKKKINVNYSTNSIMMQYIFIMPIKRINCWNRCIMFTNMWRQISIEMAASVIFIDINNSFSDINNSFIDINNSFIDINKDGWGGHLYWYHKRN